MAKIMFSSDEIFWKYIFVQKRLVAQKAKVRRRRLYYGRVFVN